MGGGDPQPQGSFLFARLLITLRRLGKAAVGEPSFAKAAWVSYRSHCVEGAVHGNLKPTKPTVYRVKPAISWPGGKSRLLKHILPLIPEHTCYCEPFAGGLAVLLAKPRSDLEVINDANEELVTFYRCVRFHADVLLTELEFVLHSRKEFNDYCRQPGLTDIQRAARWYFRNKTCFGGARMDSFGTGALVGGSSRTARMEALRALNVRLDKVRIEHLDWQHCVRLYDRSSTFFFFDPPYTECDAGMYASWTNTDVQVLRDSIAQLRGRWLLTLNDTAAIRTIFAGCAISSMERIRGINNRSGESKIYRELLISPA